MNLQTQDMKVKYLVCFLPEIVITNPTVVSRYNLVWISVWKYSQYRLNNDSSSYFHYPLIIYSNQWEKSGGPGLKPRWRRHCGIQVVSFGKALLSSHVRRVGTLTGRSRVSESILWVKNHRNTKVDFLCILPVSLGRPSITTAVEWPFNPIQSIQ